MKLSSLAFGAALVGVAVALVQKGPPRWRSVTIARTQDEVMPGGRPPQPLHDLGDLVELRMTDAPAGRGTELSARLRIGEPAGLGSLVLRTLGNDPRQRVRRALRESKQLLEVGEVMRLDPKPEGRRPSTVPGKVIDLVNRRSMEEGVL